MGIVVLVMALASWVWFGQGGLTPSSHAPAGVPSAPTDLLELRFGHNTPEDSALHQAALRFAESVLKKTDGRVRVTVFPGQQLGNDHEMVEMAREGKLDIILTPTAKLSVPVPAMQYADLPFFFPSREDVYALLDGEPGRLLLDKLNAIDLVGVTFWENGFKHFTGNRPFLHPDDFKGQKIRVMKSRLIMDQFRSFGAEPLPIDFYTTRQALADGVVAGQENPLVAIVSMGIHEVQTDLVLSEHAYLGYVFSISQKVFGRLPQDVRRVLVETAREVSPWEREETQRREQALLETIRKAGVKIHRLDPAQRQAFADKVRHIARAFEPVIGVDVMSKTEEILLQKYGPDPKARAQFVIGIDADLSLDGGSAGLAIKRGVELALDEINAGGGLLGKPVRLIARDHRVTPSMGIGNLEHFVARDDLVAVIGGKHSAVIAEEVPLIQKARIPYLVPWATAAEITDNGYPDSYLFRASANDKWVSEFLADYLLKHHRKPALLVENSIWGRGNLERITDIFRSRGVIPGALLQINRGKADFGEELDQVTASGADSILLVVNAREGAQLIRQLGARPSPLPVVSHWGILGGTFYNDVQDILPRLDLRFFQTFDADRNDNPVRNDLMARYRSSFGVQDLSRVKAPMAVAQAYDLTRLLALAITQAGSADREPVKRALEHLSAFDGAIKRYDPAFTPERHDALDRADYFIARFGADGHIVPVTD